MRALTLLSAFALTGITPAAATTYEHPLSLDELIAESERAVIGEVASSWTERTSSGLWTVAAIVVDETLRGDHQPVVEVRWPGGTVGKIELIVAGAPEIRVGETLLAFVREDGQIVGMTQGAFQLVGDKAIRDLDGLYFLEPGQTQEAFDLDEIRAQLR